MDDPCSPAKCQFLSRQYVTAPPQFFAADVTHEHYKCIVDENPPCSLQRDAHAVLWAEMAEELAVKPRRIKESYGLESGLKEPSVTLDEYGRQSPNECQPATGFLFPKG